MGERQNPSQPEWQGQNADSPSVLGDFYIENHHYLVICSEHAVEPISEHDLSCLLTDSMNSVVGQLRVNRKCCVIVEVEHHSLQDNHSDISALLTGRELQIVQLVAKGHPNKQIAHHLHISEWTVSTHLRRIFAKLHVDSRAAMVHRCASLLGNFN